MTKVRLIKPGLDKKGNRVKGHRSYKYANGYKHILKSIGIRPWQKVKNLDWHIRINVNEQDDGS